MKSWHVACQHLIPQHHRSVALHTGMQLLRSLSRLQTACIYVCAVPMLETELSDACTTYWPPAAHLPVFHIMSWRRLVVLDAELCGLGHLLGDTAGYHRRICVELHQGGGGFWKVIISFGCQHPELNQSTLLLLRHASNAIGCFEAALRVRCCDESQSCKGMISVRIAIGCTCRGIPGICFSPVLHICFLACAACLNGMRGVHVSPLAFVYQLRYWHRLAIHFPSDPIIKYQNQHFLLK